MNTLQKVGIEIGQNVYSTFEAQANTVSHVLAEFIDNAIQSYRDHKEELLAVNSGYQLHVDIHIDWGFDNEARATYNTAAKSNRFGTQDKPNKNVIRTWATTQEKSIQRISRPK